MQTQVGALIEVGLLEDCLVFCGVCSMLSLFDACVPTPRCTGSVAWISGGQHAGLSIPRFPGTNDVDISACSHG